jgi:hypothetical protein
MRHRTVLHQPGGRADVSPVRSAASFTPGPEAALFAAGRYHVDAARNDDVSIDGTRFVVIKKVTNVGRPSVTVGANRVDNARAKMAPR